MRNLLVSIAILLLAHPAFAVNTYQFLRDFESTTLSNAELNRRVPANAFDAFPIRAVASPLFLAQPGDLIQIYTSDLDILELEVTRVRNYVSGDVGISARDNSGNYLGASLIISPAGLLGEFETESGNMNIRMESNADGDLVGWIYKLDDPLESAPYDQEQTDTPAPSILQGRQTNYLEITGNGITLEQTFTNQSAYVGEIVETHLLVRNNSQTVLSNERIQIHGAPNVATYVSGPDYCNLQSGFGLGFPYYGVAAIDLNCNLPSIQVGSVLEFTVSYRMTEKSIPSVNSQIVLQLGQFANLTISDSIFTSKNTLTDTDKDGISDFNENLIGTDPEDRNSPGALSGPTKIDILMLYTDSFERDIGQVKAQTRLNYLANRANSDLDFSGIDIELVPVHYEKVGFVVDKIIDAPNDLARGIPASLGNVAYLRNLYGADIVVLVDGYIRDDDYCGSAHGGNASTQGDLTGKRNNGFLGIHIPGSAPDGGAYCSEFVLSHEVGHVLGLHHSRVEGAPGTFDWAVGYGIENEFRTIMATPSDYPNAPRTGRFSNPQLTCSFSKLIRCGRPMSDELLGADSALAANTTRFAVSQYNESRTTFDTARLSGGSADAKIMAGYFNAANNDGKFLASIKPNQPIGLAATFVMDPRDRLKIGRTHVIATSDSVNFLQMNTDGRFVHWDGQLHTLIGATEAHALQPYENLLVFDKVRFLDFGIPRLDFDIFFAYNVSGSDELVYSESPLRLIVE